jgi:serine protease inhibitor
VISSKHSVPINQIDFKKEGSSRQINGYSTSKGFSSKVVEKLSSAYKVLMLSLSSYKVCWQTKFNVNRGIVDEFRITTQKTVRVKYMIDYKSVCLIERVGHKYCSIALSDPGYCFVVSMPNVGYNPIRGLKMQFVFEATGYGMERIKVKLPEFSWENNLSLSQCLSKCGSSNLFYASSS